MTKKTKTKKLKNNLPDKPAVGPDAVTLVVSRDEMLGLAQVLLFSKTLFTEMAINLQKEGNQQEADQWNARSLLSQILFSKFKDDARIGEPESRQVH